MLQVILKHSQVWGPLLWWKQTWMPLPPIPQLKDKPHHQLSAQNTGVGSRSLLQWSSQPRDRTQVSRIAGKFFTSWAIREAPEYWSGVAHAYSRGSSQLRNWTPDLLHCRRILYQLSYQESPNFLIVTSNTTLRAKTKYSLNARHCPSNNLLRKKNIKSNGKWKKRRHYINPRTEI